MHFIALEDGKECYLSKCRLQQSTLGTLKRSWFSVDPTLNLLFISDLQDRLAQIFPFEHTKEALNSIVHAIGDVVGRLEASILDPLRNVLIASFLMLHDILVAYQEALP